MSQRVSGYEKKQIYETPAWVTHALMPFLPDRVNCIWEPACGSGKMVDAIKAVRPDAEVWGCDIEPKGHFIQADFLGDTPRVAVDDADAIITNPPYERATEFCERALQRMRGQRGVVAMLLRCDFDSAKSRSHLFRDCPAFCKKIVLMRRIVWFAGQDGKPKASPSFNHCWMLWDWKHERPPTIAYAP